MILIIVLLFPLGILNSIISWLLLPKLSLTFTSQTSPSFFVSMRSSRASSLVGSSMTCQEVYHQCTPETFWIACTHCAVLPAAIRMVKVPHEDQGLWTWGFIQKGLIYFFLTFNSTAWILWKPPFTAENSLKFKASVCRTVKNSSAEWLQCATSQLPALQLLPTWCTNIAPCSCGHTVMRDVSCACWDQKTGFLPLYFRIFSSPELETLSAWNLLERIQHW